MIDFRNSSEEAKERICKPCNNEIGRTISAEVFCENCEDYFCSTCLRAHNRYNHDHFIISDLDSLHFVTYYCGIHKNRRLQFYCKSCDVLSCVDCTGKIHKDCKSVLHLTKVVERYEEDESKIESYAQAAKATTTTVRQNVEEVISDGSDWKWMLQGYVKTSRDQMNMTFDRIKDDVDKLPEPNQTDLKKFRQTAGTLEQYIDTYMSDRQKSGFKTFVFEKTVQEQLKKLSEETRDLTQAKKIQEYCHKVRGLKPENVTDLTCFDKIPWYEINCYSKTLFQNVILELFCFAALILFVLLRPEPPSFDGQWCVQVLHICLGAGLLISILCKTLLPLKYSIPAVKVILELVLLGLYLVPFLVYRILFEFLKSMADECNVHITDTIFSILAFSYALVQMVGLFCSTLAFALYTVVLYTVVFYRDTRNAVVDVPAVWVVVGLCWIYYFIILVSSFGIRYNEVKVNNVTEFSWMRSEASLSDLRQKNLSYICRNVYLRYRF